MSVAKCFKSYFFRGLAVLLPTILTIWILVWGYKFIRDSIGIHIKRGLFKLIILAGGSETELGKFWIDGALTIGGFVLALVGVCIVGMVLASVVGRSLWRIIEKFIMNTPFLRQIYPYVKQITDFLLTQEEQKKLFSQVVAVEYPRKGIWAMGMVTGCGLKKIVDKVEKEFITVFIPTSPTPFTGFVIMVPKEQTIDLDMTIEEALRFAVSGGVIVPERSRTAAALSRSSS
jgi:uncharacterized membrane protein